MTEPLQPDGAAPISSPSASPPPRKPWQRKPVILGAAGTGAAVALLAVVSALAFASSGHSEVRHARGISTQRAAASSAATVVAPPSSAPPASTSPPMAAAAPSCSQQVQDWKGTPGAQALSQAVSALQNVSSDGQAGDFTAVAGDLDQLGAVASTMQGYALPSCADKHHYWEKITSAMEDAASQSTGVANADITALQQATSDASQFDADAAALISELKNEGLW